MTQYFPFIPSDVAAPTFRPLLDGWTCTVVVTWNVAAQRYYINVYNYDGSLAVARALVESPPGLALVDLAWDANRNVVTATIAQEWRRPVGQIVQYTIQDCQPDALNGVFDCLVLNDTQFSYGLATYPGPVSVLGAVQRDLDMLKGWFQSSMAFRDDTFIVRP